MKIHLLWLIIILVAGQTNKSDLELLVEDLSILARVTNAISLQTGAFEGSVRLEDVVTEFVAVSNKDFRTLMGIDSEAILKTVNEFHEKSKTVNTVDLGSIEQLLDDADYLSGVTDQYDYLKMAATDGANLLKDFLGKLSDRTLVKNLEACDTKLLELFSELSDWTQGKWLRMRRQQLEMLNEASGKIDQFFNCLDSLQKYEVKVKNSPIMKTFETWNNIEELERVVEIFQNRKAAASNSGAMMSSVQKFYKDTVSLIGISDDGSGAANILKTVFDTLQSIRRNGRENEEELTAGFQNTNDVGKVLADIRSDWFMKIVAKTTNVTHFEKSLQPFKLFAESIEKFGNKWDLTINAARGSESVFESVGEFIGNIAKFGRIDLTDAQVGHASSCWNQLETIFDLTELRRFYLAYRDPLEMYSQVRLLVEKIRKLRRRAEVKELKNSLKQFKEDFTGKKLRLENVAEFVKYTSRQYYFHDLYYGLETIVGIRDTQKRFLELVKITKARDPNDFSIKTSVRLSKTVDVVECLRDKANIKNLRDVLIYLVQVKNMADSNIISVVTTFLENMRDVKLAMQNVVAATAKATNMSKPTWKFPNSKSLASSIGEGVHVLRELNKLLNFKSVFEEVTRFHSNSFVGPRLRVSAHLSSFWRDPMTFYGSLNNLSQSLTPLAKKLHQNGSLSEMKQVFEKAANISGLPTDRADLTKIAETLERFGFHNESKVVERLSELELNFASHDLKGAALSLISLEDNFDALFGNRPSTAPRKEIQIKREVDPISFLYFIVLCLGLLLLLLLLALGICAITPSGRAKYVNTYLYYFGKDKDFEKRWRYSLFRDRQDGKNALIDAVREVNVTNVQKTLKKGAYVNVYNFHGNTCLHSATKLGHPEIVKLLIKNGADRTLLNHQNKVPEEMIPSNLQQKAKAAEYEVIRSIYSKYRKKVFRMNVPEVFPVSSFHIYIEERTDNNLTNAFMDRFQSITSEEPLPTTTHCIVKTTEDGVLETDQFMLLAWIFNGVIIVKDSWMADCLKDERLIRHDSSYLVEKVRFKGVLFQHAVLPWSRAMAKGTMPFLYGVHVAVVMREYNNLMPLAALVTAQGGTMLNSFPQKENYNKGSHPYLHSNLGPLFIIHDGQINLDAYKNDEMFTLFTEDQFLTFMLKREVSPIPQADPVSVVTSESIN